MSTKTKDNSVTKYISNLVKKEDHPAIIRFITYEFFKTLLEHQVIIILMIYEFYPEVLSKLPILIFIFQLIETFLRNRYYTLKNVFASYYGSTIRNNIFKALSKSELDVLDVMDYEGISSLASKSESIAFNLIEYTAAAIKTVVLIIIVFINLFMMNPYIAPIFIVINTSICIAYFGITNDFLLKMKDYNKKYLPFIKFANTNIGEVYKFIINQEDKVFITTVGRESKAAIKQYVKLLVNNDKNFSISYVVTDFIMFLIMVYFANGKFTSIFMLTYIAGSVTSNFDHVVAGFRKIQIILSDLYTLQDISNLKKRTLCNQVDIKGKFKLRMDNLSFNNKSFKMSIKDYNNPKTKCVEPGAIFLRSGYHACVTGDSGCGKSTFIKMLKSIYKIGKNEEKDRNLQYTLRLKHGEPGDEYSTSKMVELDNGFESIFCEVFYSGQNSPLKINSLFYQIVSNYDLEWKDNIDVILEIKRLLKLGVVEHIDEDGELVEDDKFGIDKMIDLSQISGGQRQRLNISRDLYRLLKAKKREKLSQSPDYKGEKIFSKKILVFDEIDTQIQASLSLDIFKYLRETYSDCCILVITHNENVKRSFPNRIHINNNSEICQYRYEATERHIEYRDDDKNKDCDEGDDQE